MTQATVYLLDDEPAMVELLGEVAEAVGLQAQGYTRAGRFFEQVPVPAPGSILVLDLQMPGMDGIEVMRRLAQLAVPPALILVSGQEEGVLHAAEELGQAHGLKVLASLGKPIAIAQFRQLLERQAPLGRAIQHSRSSAAQPTFTPNELHAAIRGGQLILHYQPQVAFATGKLVGVEALVRWQHPTQGLIYPDCFIPLIEQYGWMGELTHWVTAEAIRQARQWQDSGLPVTISINISASDLADLTLPDQLATLLTAHQLDPAMITLEVTESALMGRLATSLDILTRLRLRGFGLSIDDFGTGYSSLLQLRRAPFTELKVDQSFVMPMGTDIEALAIVKACILLGHEFDLQVVAEGVEDQHAWELLAGQGCDIAQGYFIARPMAGNDLPKWIQRRETGL